MSSSVALRRTRDLALLGAVLWGAGLVAAGLTVPIYTMETREFTPGGRTSTSTTSSTLVEANGPDALIPLAVPLVGAVVVAISLLVLPRLLGHAIAWTTTFLLAALAALAALSIGTYLAPVVAALLVACVVDAVRTYEEERSTPAAGAAGR
ncbi:hypothetical protein [Nocardioides sp. TF02-7]|uniref:hypothetical protein n=1 Tax=Nocardioides sp. TF02-7 TaxID=2917724 RepID=UPI001F0587C2|nr:hypothetical protein [Nocardioides sp. TF02-7]UMG94603.1 hypothetical protein MF408_12005 [Nocardioides sp. TF02-7]